VHSFGKRRFSESSDIDRCSRVIYGEPDGFCSPRRSELPACSGFPAVCEGRQAVPSPSIGEGHIPHMTIHSHRFVEEYDGFVGFGLNRESDINTLVVYLQKMADDTLARTLAERMTDEERLAFFDALGRLLKNHLSEEEYHRLFLKDR
jgi:hypothetical protein